MLSFRSRPISIMIGFSILLHLVWAATILVDDSAVGATALSALHRYVQDPRYLSGLIASAAFLAFGALWTKRPWIVLLLIPQQILLCMSAAGAIEAMWLSQFADGVFRPRAFIIADQCYCVLAAIGHTVAIVVHAGRLSK